MPGPDDDLTAEAPRTTWYVPALGRDFRLDDDRVQAGDRLANVVGSPGLDGAHYPVIDLDGPHRYRPSSTPGHGHLFLDQPLSWRRYERILRALADAEVIGWPEYVRALDRGGTFVNRPHIRKDPRRHRRLPTATFWAVFFRLWARAGWRELRRQLAER